MKLTFFQRCSIEFDFVRLDSGIEHNQTLTEFFLTRFCSIIELIEPNHSFKFNWVR